MALDEREEVREHLEEADEAEGLYLDEKRTQVCYSTLRCYSPCPCRLIEVSMPAIREPVLFASKRA